MAEITDRGVAKKGCLHLSAEEMSIFPRIVDLIREVRILTERVDGLCARTDRIRRAERYAWHETD